MKEFFYRKYTVPISPADKGFVPVNFGFIASNVKLYNESANVIEFSFDCENVQGELLGSAPMNYLEFLNYHTHRVGLRSAAGGEIVHIYAWRSS
jgi:hypothetical protein